MDLTTSIKRLLPTAIKTKLRGLLGAFPSRRAVAKRWRIDPEGLPWFDRPDALDLLAQRRRTESLTHEEYGHLHQWTTDGYFVLPGAITPALIDAMALDLDALWTAGHACPGLEIDGLRLRPDAPPVKLSHRELLALAPSDRTAARDGSNWRVHAFPKYSPSAKAIFEHAELRRQASLILGRPSSPGYAINFMYGSAQTEHQDTAVFHVFPPNYIVGAWIACEDISPDSGPLMFW